MSIPSAASRTTASPGGLSPGAPDDGWPPEDETLPPPPQRVPSPFDALGPHPLAQHAARALQQRFATGELAPGVPASLLEGPHGGKMFGVLVVRGDDGRLGALHAFSGMLAGRWNHPGFCPPLFDPEVRAALERPGADTVASLDARHRTLAQDPEALATSATLSGLRAAHAEALESLRLQHRERREARRARREALSATATSPTRDALHALEQESRADKAQKRGLLASQERALAPVVQAEARHLRRLQASARLRRHVSATLMRGIHDTYVLHDARGEACGLREAFAPAVPPSGAGDCAAPKLLAEAYRRGLTPIALAEFWWGAPPPAGGQVHGAWVRACATKCGPILEVMLRGLNVAPPRHFEPPDPTGLPLPIVHRDAHLVVVHKPAGLLSVPGRDPAHHDSVQARLRDLFPDARGPLLVHRLDLDTSGLLIAALTPQVHRDLQRQFLERTVEKRYLAVLAHAPKALCAQGQGEVHLALRGDPDLRPQQIHDPIHGRPAHTSWRLLSTDDAQRARVELIPHTGRTHQLRVHTSHPLGLGVPILGDRLYGEAGPRLHLHAAGLAVTHPITGQRLHLEVPAPF